MKTALHRPFIPSSGLTLLELLVVLSILAVLSTVALTSSSGLADQARYEATQRTLENIREAVLGPANLRDTDGTLLYTGFVADTGRLPRAVLNGADFTLVELWENVNGMALHEVRAAEDAFVDDDDHDDPEVFLATGWRGPYLNLAPGSDEIIDGWGAPFVLRTQAGGAVAAITDEIGQVHSFGADQLENLADTGYERDMAKRFEESQIDSSIAVTVELRNSDGTPAVAVPTDSIMVRLFSPDPTNGLIRVEPDEDPFSSSSLTFNFTNQTPGPRVVRAYYDEGNNDTPADDASIESKSAITNFILRPGGNQRTIILTVP